MMPADPPSPPRLRPCPLCGAPLADRAFAPFCSRGCRDRDLIGWLDERYAVPVSPETDEDGDPAD